MSKPLLGLLLGVILGAFDGLSALVSSPTPEVKAGIVGIVIGSTFKGLIVGLIAGYFAWKRRSLTAGLLVGGVAGLFFAFVVAYLQAQSGQPAWLEIMLPGTLVGLIVGYATQRYGRPAQTAAA